MSFHLSTKERLLLLIDDMELISKYVFSCIKDVYQPVNIITFQRTYRKFVPKTPEDIDGGAYSISRSSCGEG